MKAWRRLGEILVTEGFLTEAAVATAVEEAEEGVRIGEHLVGKGLLSETQLAQALAHQLSIPWVSIVHIDFRPEILERISSEMAVRLRVVPVYVQQARGQEPTLFVAMADPTNEEALAELGQTTRMPVRAMVGARGDLLSAIRFYYGITVEEPAGARKAEEKSDPALSRKSETRIDDKGKGEAKPPAHGSRQAPPLPMRAKMASLTGEAMRPPDPVPSLAPPKDPGPKRT